MKVIHIFTCIFSFLVSVSTRAAIIYSDFANVTGLQINNDAAQVGNVLRLTPALRGQAGSAFSTSTISLNNNASFSTAFDFQINDSAGSGGGADGLVFVIQTLSNTAGGSGGGIGYAGLSNSIGIEFDTFANGSGDSNNGNHIGLNTNGSASSNIIHNVATSFKNGDLWRAWVDYNGNTDLIEVFLCTRQFINQS